VDEMGGICSKHGKVKNLYKILIKKFQGNRTFGRHSCKLDDKIKI
jgi:hypothetical protein